MDKVNHFELPTKDKKRAKSFYSKIFGWKTIDMPDMDYTMVHTGPTDEKGMVQERGFINGGMTTDDPAGGPVIVIGVNSIEDTLEKIKQNGGKTVLDKQEVGDIGLYARFEDPEGNIIGIWQDK